MDGGLESLCPERSFWGDVGEIFKGENVSYDTVVAGMLLTTHDSRSLNLFPLLLSLLFFIMSGSPDLRLSRAILTYACRYICRRGVPWRCIG